MGLSFWDELLRSHNMLATQVLAGEKPWQFAASMAVRVVCLGGFYGAMMGVAGGWRQSLASAGKVPTMFLATLAICFPVLYVVNVLLGPGLTMGQVAAFILTSLAFNCVLLASCGPMCAFFSTSGSSYHFMKLLHVTIFGICGVSGMVVLSTALGQAAARTGGNSFRGSVVFFIWAMVFGFVGTQMAWRLRPLIGDPGLPFQFLRKRRSGLNFYSAVMLSMRRMNRTRHERRAAAVYS